MSKARWCVAAVLGLGLLAAQGRRLTFDAASVKPATVPDGVAVLGNSMTISKGRGDFERLRSTGGPGTTDPGRIHYPLVSLKGLLDRAFETYFEVDGPGWLDTDVVSVDATMPPDTTQEQFREMLQNLIVDRFAMKYHVATKEIAGYALVFAKGGPKLKESSEVAAPPPPPPQNDVPAQPQPRKMGPDGFPIPPRRVGAGFMFQAMPGERARLIGDRKTVADLSQSLGELLGSRVTDTTGLKGKYDITLSFAGHFGPHGVEAALQPQAAASDPAAPEPLPDIFSALQSQLGLKLEPKKIPVETVVVDRIDKAPIGN